MKDEFFQWDDKPIESIACKAPQKRGMKPKAAEKFILSARARLGFSPTGDRLHPTPGLICICS